MDNYIAQKHLELLCKAQQIANTELKRIKEFERTNEGLVEFAKWYKIFQEDNKLIESYMSTLKKENVKIIVADRDVIYALIFYFAGNIEADFELINIDEKFKELYPDDEASKKFMEGYTEHQFGKILDAFEMIY